MKKVSFGCENFFRKKEKFFLAEYVYKKSPAAGTAGEEKGG